MKAFEMLEILAKRPNKTNVLYEAKGINYILEGFETVEKCFQVYSKLNPNTEIKFYIDGTEYEINGFTIPEVRQNESIKIVFKNG